MAFLSRTGFSVHKKVRLKQFCSLHCLKSQLGGLQDQVKRANSFEKNNFD